MGAAFGIAAGTLTVDLHHETIHVVALGQILHHWHKSMEIEGTRDEYLLVLFSAFAVHYFTPIG